MTTQNKEVWQKLMIKAQKGDQKAYHELLRSVRPVVTRYVSSKVFDKTLVEDITQDVLIGLHNARHTYQHEKPFMPWFNAIIHHKTVDAFRKIGRNKEDQLSTGEDIETFFPQTTNKEEQALLRKDLTKVLKSLPDQQQKIVVLMKIHGLSVKEVSKVLNLSASAVKVSAHRAYKSMQQILGN